MRRRLVAGLLAVLSVTACTQSSDDPGLDPGLVDGSGVTSNTLGQCPPGGPDETTPAAGCLDQDGVVRRP